MPVRAILAFAAAVAAASAAPQVVARVRDGETGRPLAGAVVTSEGSDIMAVTDSGGLCAVIAAPRKGGAIVAARAGYLDQRLYGAWPRKAGGETAFVDLSVYPARRRVVVGRVTDAGTKLVLPGVEVMPAGRPEVETTATDGSFAFDSFPAGPQKLAATAAGFPVRTVEVLAPGGETTEVNFALYDTANTGRVEGIVFDKATGTPLPGARVELGGTGLFSVSDPAGAYAIENVPAGQHRVLAEHGGHAHGYTFVRVLKDWTATVNLYLQAAPAGTPAPEK
jgi:hypothetical protein